MNLPSRLLLLLAGLSLAGLASAHEYTAGDLKIIHPTSRPTPLVGGTGAGYVGIRNDGKTADTLLGASSALTDKIEIHEMSMDGGVMRMRVLSDGVPIPAGGRADLTPGGAHLMLIGLKRTLKPGETLPITLEFAKAGKVPVELHVEAVTAAGGEAGAMHHH